MSGIQAQAAAVTAGPAFWSEVLAWAKLSSRLTPSDASILQALSTPGKLGSEKQSVRAVELLSSLNREGCELTLPASIEVVLEPE